MAISPFMSCISPLEIYVRKSQKMFVPCRKCPACNNTRRAALSTQLQLEENNAKYCYFLTLTYDDSHLPLYKLVDDDTLSDFMLPIPISDRIVSDFDPNNFDNVADPGILVAKSDKLFNSLSSYSKQITFYEASSHVSLCYGHGTFALLYYRDIQLFLKRLRKYINKHFDEKIRYYVIGEYGTRSLRPHWHILLFFNSSLLSKEFETVDNVGSSSRRCECPCFLRSLWKYGIIDSKRSDGKAFSYVSSYCAKSSNFPFVLDVLSPQKAYHSRFFGAVRSEEDLLSALYEHDYERFAVSSLPSFDGSVRSYTLWRSYYSQFLPLYSGISSQTIEETFRVFTVWKRIVSLYGDITVIRASRLIWDSFIHPEFQTFSEMSICKTLEVQLNLSLHSDHNVLSSLQSALRASRKFLYYADLLSLSPLSYFDIWRGFYKYLGLKRLSDLYSVMELDSSFTDDYYSQMSFNLDGSSVPCCYWSDDNISFQSFKSQQILKYNGSIKHRKTVELINNQLNLI